MYVSRSFNSSTSENNSHGERMSTTAGMNVALAFSSVSWAGGWVRRISGMSSWSAVSCSGSKMRMSLPAVGSSESGRTPKLGSFFFLRTTGSAFSWW